MSFAISAAVLAQIHTELRRVEDEEEVRILYAVESGSRAWGFASEDSDYDVRFIYARPRDWYLTIDLEQQRDVIERMLPGDLDLSGWDIRKALRLFAKSNPPLLEWLDSPIVYCEDGEFIAPLRGFLRGYYSPASCLHHYLRMARNNTTAYLRGETVRLKKYFYILRPLLAARWIAENRGPAPMLFSQLLDTLNNQEQELRDVVNRLLEQKKSSVELDRGPRIEAIDRFTESELPRLEALAATMPKPVPDLGALNELFRMTIGA